MKFKGYNYKFKLNISHSVLIYNKMGKVHFHTFEISIFLRMLNNKFIIYNKAEQIIKKVLDKYSDKQLNMIEPFDKLDPTIENIGDVLYSKLKEVLENNSMELVRLEMSETPARTYIVNGGNRKVSKLHRQIMRIALNNIIKLSENDILDEIYGKSQKELAELSQIENRKQPEYKGIVKDKENTLEVQNEIQKIIPNTIHKKQTRQIGIAVVILAVVTWLLVFYVIKQGQYPWGLDTYGHIFKADLLYDNILKGNFYPLFTEFWYNGIQPFRYWGPFTYYIMACCQLIAGGSPLEGYVVFVGLIFFIGGMGWLLWGFSEDRIFLSLIFALLWFFLPENTRILFLEGNLPRVLVTAFLPYFFYFLWQFVNYKKVLYLIPMMLFMVVIIMCHLMLGAMIGIACFIFLLVHSFMIKKFKRSFQTIVTLILCFILCGIWIYPALHGGLVSMNSDATSQVMKSLSTPVKMSLNPFLRLNPTGIGYFYYGISIFAVSILGMFFSNRKSSAGFTVTLIIFVGTTTAFVPLLDKLPLNQLLWMRRFTPIAYGLFIISLINWKKCKKIIMAFMILFIVADSSLSFNLPFYSKNEPYNAKSIIEEAKGITKQRIALLDSSLFGSYPSFFITDERRKLPYSYGWAWQGAATSQNIVLLNTALEQGYYNYMFDRAVEMGCDTVVLRKESLPKNNRNIKNIKTAAALSDYNLYSEDKSAYIFHRFTPAQFGVITRYGGICIGNSSIEVPLQYPYFKIGSSYNIDDYSIKELKKYKIVYLSDFKYRDKSKAENMISKLSSLGVKVIIDMNRIPADETTNRMEFLKVEAQPVTFNLKMPDLFFKGKKYVPVVFKKEYENWNTVYLEGNLDTWGFSWLNHKKLAFAGKGKGINKNVIFVGFNLMFHSMENKDVNSIKIMNSIFGIDSSLLPKRSIENIQVKYEKNFIKIRASKDSENTTIAFLDAYKSNKRIFSDQNLLNVDKGETGIRITYPYFIPGIIISLTGCILSVIWLNFIYRKGKGDEKNEKNL